MPAPGKFAAHLFVHVVVDGQIDPKRCERHRIAGFQLQLNLTDGGGLAAADQHAAVAVQLHRGIRAQKRHCRTGEMGRAEGLKFLNGGQFFRRAQLNELRNGQLGIVCLALPLVAVAGIVPGVFMVTMGTPFSRRNRNTQCCSL